MVVMLLPTINDILFGRGNAIWNQEGNRRLRHIIDKYQKEYHLATTTRAQKIQITHMIMKEIGATGARFMEYDRFVHEWYEVDRTQAIEKIGHALRHRKAKVLKNEEARNDIKFQQRGTIKSRLLTPNGDKVLTHSDINGRAKGATVKHLPAYPVVERDLLEQYAMVSVSTYIAYYSPRLAHARSTPPSSPFLQRTSSGGHTSPGQEGKNKVSRPCVINGVSVIIVDDPIANCVQLGSLVKTMSAHQQQQKQDRSNALGDHQNLERRDKTYADLGHEVSLDYGQEATLSVVDDSTEFKNRASKEETAVRSFKWNVVSGPQSLLHPVGEAAEFPATDAVLGSAGNLLKIPNDSAQYSSNLATQMRLSAVCDTGGAGYSI